MVVAAWRRGGCVPLSILIAFLFNQVLSKTALLWTKNKIVAAIPIMVWLAGFLAFAVNDGVKGDILVGADVRGLLLLAPGWLVAVGPLP